MENNEKQLKEAFENLMNKLHEFEQNEINKEGIQKTIDVVYEMAKGNEKRLLSYAIDNYYAVIEGCTKEREREYLLFIKTIVEKMIEERR